MAAAYNQSNPPRKNQAFTVQVALQDMANPGSFKSSPTIAAGDFKCGFDGVTGGGAGTLANITTLPSVDPAAGIWVNIALTASEMNGNVIYIQAIDQTSPKEWGDVALCILTSP